MSIHLPPSESKGISMREYQRIYPYTLSEPTLTESRMVHRALMHRLNKDLKAWQHQYRWQRLRAMPLAMLQHFHLALKTVIHAAENVKSKVLRWLLRAQSSPRSASFSLSLPRESKVQVRSTKSKAYRF